MTGELRELNILLEWMLEHQDVLLNTTEQYVDPEDFEGWIERAVKKYNSLLDENRYGVVYSTERNERMEELSELLDAILNFARFTPHTIEV